MITRFAKTKILATAGPAVESAESFHEIVKRGVDGIRLNMSHGNYEFHRKILRMIDSYNSQNTFLSTLADLQGPKIRIGEIENGKVILEKDSVIEIRKNPVLGTNKKISTSFPGIIDDASIADRILINDGLIELKVEEKSEEYLLCRILEGGELLPRKGINLPGMKLNIPSLTQKDLNDLDFLSEYKIDFLALSFVRSPDDILQLRKILNEKKIETRIIAKIEKPEAIKNIDEIISVSDGVMIARGDLGIEINYFEVPLIQKSIISKCKTHGKLSIVATQMLETMITNPIPTRAEVSDVANAVFDGTDVVMLSGETSVGSHPERAVDIMNNIVGNNESTFNRFDNMSNVIIEDVFENIFDATARSVVSISDQINPAAIVVFTSEGRKANRISKYRPRIPIFAVSENIGALTSLNLRWGIIPIKLKSSGSIDEDIAFVNDFLIKNSFIKKKDLIIYTSGEPLLEKGREDWIKFLLI